MPMIHVEAIDIPTGRRPVDEEDVSDLALNIKAIGLLNAIIIIENKEMPGRFILVAGRHRLLAVRLLGWEQIDSRVLVYSEVQARMAEASENLFRTNLDPIERDKALKTWKDCYEAMYPESLGFHIRDSKLRQHDQEDSANDATETVSAVTALASKTGLNKRSIQRAVKRADRFTDDEREILKRQGLSLHQVDQVCAIDDPETRTEAVKLIGAGMMVEDALHDVGVEFEAEANGEAHDDSPILSPEDQLTDESWLEQMPIRHRCNTSRFDEDALLYRRLKVARLVFASTDHASTLLNGRKIGNGGRGKYASLARRFLSCPHPRDWITCGDCVKGQTKGTECGRCGGGGYKLGG